MGKIEISEEVQRRVVLLQGAAQWAIMVYKLYEQTGQSVLITPEIFEELERHLIEAGVIEEKVDGEKTNEGGGQGEVRGDRDQHGGHLQEGPGVPVRVIDTGLVGVAVTQDQLGRVRVSHEGAEVNDVHDASPEAGDGPGTPDEG